MKKIKLLSFYIFCSIGLMAQQTGKSTLKGHVLDSGTEEHLPGVTVSIEGKQSAVMTDETGHFVLGGLLPGTYAVVTQYIGYSPLRQEVSVGVNEIKNVTLYIEPEDQQLDEIMITASANALNRKISPVVVNKLTTKAFEATNSTSLSQGLNYMPGLRVETNCQNCGTQEVRINGLEGQYSQMLIDGQPVFSSLSKMYGLEQMPTNMIEQVEVIRGGGSVLYGANAIGGVINIITKEPEKNSYQAKYNMSLIDGKSADNTLYLNSSFVDRSKKSGISLFANMRNRNPWDANNDGFSEIGKNRTSSLGFRSFLKPTSHDKFTLECHYISEYRRGGDNMSRPPHEALIAETTDYRIHSGGMGYTHLSDDHKQKLTVNMSVQKTGRDSYYGGGYDPDGYGNTSELALTGTVRYEVNMDKLLFMPAKFTAGFTQEYTNLHDTIHSRNVKQIVNMSSLYLQNEWRDDALTFIIGLRGDKHNKLSNINLIPRSSIRYRLGEKVNLRAAYSMGYRAPEIIASDLDIPVIGGSATITQLGKELKREYSNTINGGADFSFYNENIYSYFLLEGFYTKINNVFVVQETGVDAAGNTLMTRVNGDGAYVYGVNLETTVQPLSWLEIQGGFTWQRSRYTKPVSWSSEEYVQPVKKMLRSPDTYGFFSATASPKKQYSVSLSGVYTGSMLAPHFAGAEGVLKDETVKTKSFFDTTLKLSYFFNLNTKNMLEINAGVQNMFNQIQKDYDRGPNRDSEYIYGPSLPRTFFVGLKITSI
ncbi:TonB-dependent receptor [Dysgonomonas sp. Marseille-P4677]|uniref:TonB-dependent receptor n=1 Tax=Dysgonomonas sp. Marseille-P4677 TaxID=2364790 RepID=UPI0019135D8D|nr:TonB-dependent receptor [Dysgonomonas sp. Marseille-P4677]MBK5719493.1 TonB-dependent receptor [Dysgonomonas sp. Marseille-P4677]